MEIKKTWSCFRPPFCTLFRLSRRRGKWGEINNETVVEWVRTCDRVIRSPARYLWTTAPPMLLYEVSVCGPLRLLCYCMKYLSLDHCACYAIVWSICLCVSFICPVNISRMSCAFLCLLPFCYILGRNLSVRMLIFCVLLVKSQISSLLYPPYECTRYIMILYLIFSHGTDICHISD